MEPASTWASALSLLLIHDETGCRHSALNAARVLEQLSEARELDSETRALLERASLRLGQREVAHARTA